MKESKHSGNPNYEKKMNSEFPAGVCSYADDPAGKNSSHGHIEVPTSAVNTKVPDG